MVVEPEPDALPDDVAAAAADDDEEDGPAVAAVLDDGPARSSKSSPKGVSLSLAPGLRTNDADLFAPAGGTYSPSAICCNLLILSSLSTSYLAASLSVITPALRYSCSLIARRLNVSW